MTVTIYSTHPEGHTFDGVAEILRTIGCPTGLRTTTPFGDAELFQLPRFGPARCEHTRRWSTHDRFPVAVVLSAAELGYPIDHLGKSAITAAVRRTKFTRELLQRLSAVPGVLYGTVDIEQPVPTPTALPSLRLPLDLYLSNTLLLPDTVRHLDQLYAGAEGSSITWSHGRFYTTLPDPRGMRRRRPDNENLSAAVTATVARAITSLPPSKNPVDAAAADR
ncbi:hypothetical protein ACFXK0_15755 [Nocardia sp. NPDC059177]|uniref:hypothetical protein n=1 Tax=Nocardia sp. NPDC059177 TaxID=3346759 RepID=UPI003684ECD9